MVWGEDLATVFTIHNLSTVVEPLDTFSKLFSPIFTVDIKCRKVIFRVIFRLFNSLPVAIFTAFKSRFFNIFLELSRGKGKRCWWRATQRRNWGRGFLRGGLTPE